MKSNYVQQFKTARSEVDKKIDDYFNASLLNKNPEQNKKYQSWLTLFDKKDTPDSVKEFEAFMQHEMQHDNKKTP